MGLHAGRSFKGSLNRMELDCPCEKEPCGLVDLDKTDEKCDQHSFMAGKTLRQFHKPEECEES